MKNPYAGYTVLCLVIALASSMFLGETQRPYPIVSIKFCPKTANQVPNYGKEFSQRAQEKLDKEYCRYERKLLKEVWEQKQFESETPIPESALIIRNIPATQSNAIWFLVAPIASGLAYLSWAKKTEIKEELAYYELEGYKTEIKEISVNARNERDFKSKQIDSNWDKLRVKAGHISVEGMQDKFKRQTEVQDKTHASALKQFDLADSEMDKKIAENLRDKHKADKESQKVLGMKNSDLELESTTSTKLELEEQYRWIYQLLKLPFRVLSGEQGSGKSTLERLMIRLLKDAGYHIVIVNPETNPSVWGGVQVLTDAPEINIFFENFPVTIQERKQQAIDMGIDEDDYLDYLKDKSGLEGKVAIFLMESNTYEVHGVDPDHWANFLKQSLTNIRKWGFTVCLTAHSDNQTAVSSKLSGFSKLIDTAPRVECISTTNKDGEAVSSGKAWLKMKGVNDKESVEVSLYNYPKTKKF
ncbi:MAG: ATP-binding protein [Calothrix sp. C42_A2020_038]|nr:ATP-binding protein [Calothrix sp. C42_A2020_038]